MEKMVNSLETEIQLTAKKFIETISQNNNKEILVISHFDTDGISSATIMIKALKRIDKKFSIKILKSLEEQFIYDLSNEKDKIIIFLDLASGSLNYIADTQLKDIYIIDHHEIIQKIPENVNIINPELHERQKISSSGLTYLFCKELDSKNKDLAKLAILGMIGDCLEKEIDKLNNGILNDGEVIKKRGLLIYPSTRPLNRVLEFSSRPFIPEVTGDIKGVLELLRESGINPVNGKYKSLVELNEDEMSKLVTSIMLRTQKSAGLKEEIIGDIFLIKLFNKLEDAREISAIVNACSRFGQSYTAIQFLMEIPKAKKNAETIHRKYRQLLINGLKFISKTEKISGEGYVIINAKEEIKDTMIGTIASILSNSSVYQEGTIIIAMALNELRDKIKISARNVGRTGRNARELLNRVVSEIGQGEVGGHEFAAGCIISVQKEKEFINLIKENFEIEVVRV